MRSKLRNILTEPPATFDSLRGAPVGGKKDRQAATREVDAKTLLRVGDDQCSETKLRYVAHTREPFILIVSRFKAPP